MMFTTTEVKYSRTRLDGRSTSSSSSTPTTSRTARPAMRGIGSSHPDPYSACGGTPALYAGRCTRSEREVCACCARSGSIDAIPAYIQRVKKGAVRLMGLWTPRLQELRPQSQIIKQIAEQVFDRDRQEPLIDIAVELERIALQRSTS